MFFIKVIPPAGTLENSCACFSFRREKSFYDMIVAIIMPIKAA
jgi:hypothetical protein